MFRNCFRSDIARKFNKENGKWHDIEEEIFFIVKYATIICFIYKFIKKYSFTVQEYKGAQLCHHSLKYIILISYNISHGCFAVFLIK